LHARAALFHHDARRRDQPIQEAITHAPLLAWRLFLGWVVSTRSGS
jgi:hypothetical protein